MWPFSKKVRDLDELPALDASMWSVARGEYDGGPLIVRFNTDAKEWVGHPGLPIKLGFAIPLNRPNEGGLPEPAENEQLGEVEDLIYRAVGAATKAVPALVLTNGVMKELVFYIPEGVDIKTLHESIAASVSTHEVQCIAVVENDWRTYRAMSP
jgi:hypothetical protein